MQGLWLSDHLGCPMGLTCKRLKSTCETFVYLCVDETNYPKYRTEMLKSNGLEALEANSQDLEK
jgi:hypothetical protein